MPSEQLESEISAPAAGGDTTAVAEAPPDDPGEPNPQDLLAEKAEKADMAAFEKATGQKATAEGKPVPTESQPEAAEPEPQTEEPEGEPPAQPDYSKALAAFEKVELPEGRLDQIKADPEAAAITAILRDGMPRADVEQWIDRDPQGMVQYGLKRLAGQSHVDTFQGKLDRAQKDTDPDDNGQHPEAPDIVQILNLSETIDPIVAHVTESYDAELAGHFKAGLEGVTRKLGNAVMEGMAGQQNSIQVFGQALEEAQIEAARYRLSESYPQLKDDKHFTETVLPFYSKLVKTGEYRTPGKALQDAAKASSNVAGLEELQEKMASRQQRRKASQPRTTGVQVTPDKKELSSIEQDRAVFDRGRAKRAK